MRIVERVAGAGVERDKAGRKGIVCVPVWHHGGGDVSRVPRYTKVLRSSTATIQGRVASRCQSSRESDSESSLDHFGSKSIAFLSLNCLVLGPGPR